MTTDFRALCAELVEKVEYTWGSSIPADVWELLNQVSAALADEPAAPEGREPAAVTGQPSDEDLWNTADLVFQANSWPTDAIRYARAVLARWGNRQGSLDSSPPADGEVAKLVGWLRDHAYVLNPSAERKARRICVLLQHQALPGVAVSERPPGPEDRDAEGRSWWFIPASVMPNGTCPCWCLAPAESPRPWFTHWRPAHALPIPQQQESDNG